MEHYHSNHETTLSAVVGVLPSLQNVVCSQLDSDTIMAQLKTKYTPIVFFLWRLSSTPQIKHPSD